MNFSWTVLGGSPLVIAVSREARDTQARRGPASPASSLDFRSCGRVSVFLNDVAVSMASTARLDFHLHPRPNRETRSRPRSPLTAPQRRARAKLSAASNWSKPRPAQEAPSFRFGSERVLRRTAPGDPRYRRSAGAAGGGLGGLTPVDEDFEAGEDEQHRPGSSSSSSSSCSSSSSDGDGDQGGEREGLAISPPGEVDPDPVAACRERFATAWVHFPHVQLVFLYLAFGGAVASQAAAARSANCPAISVTAVVALVRSTTPSLRLS